LGEDLIRVAKVRPQWDEHGVFRLKSRQAGDLRPIQFKRYRSKGSDDGGRRPAGFFRLEFSRPVLGPLALGHSSHFGMGLFSPVATP
jgi:CRISPR-associated protein Csb2